MDRPGRNGGTLRSFQKGQSGNRAGRPKGSRNRSTVALELLQMSQSIVNPLTGERDLLSVEEIITILQIREAFKGNTRAYVALMDSAYGKPDRAVDYGNPVINLSSASNPSLLIREQLGERIHLLQTRIVESQPLLDSSRHDVEVDKPQSCQDQNRTGSRG
ncbi:hypothetical protein GO755_24675 [Spirosoma sp. HMF4905]|uniref:DUF5681 domain-containing protein n=1 Tax=Spirosoma arboris TaxID=2682092 RepID=A0A7K1SHQ3_9BACT|nr:DUF5681 domain-containing protein [Spirosoma arboris]MVM33258.1 hypothetical protein [Spirosoma arboris]